MFLISHYGQFELRQYIPWGILAFWSNYLSGISLFTSEVALHQWFSNYGTHTTCGTRRCSRW